MSAYDDAVAREEENRVLAYLGVGRPLFGLMLAGLTWRHVLELSLARNAFFIGREPTRQEVFDFLWRLNLHYERPNGKLVNWPADARRPGLIGRSLTRMRCRYIAYSLPVAVLEKTIRAWINESWQDMPVGEPDKQGSAFSKLAPRLNWFDTISSYFAFDRLDTVLDCPVALTFQRIRADFIRNGKESRCIPPSAALISFQD